MSRLVPKLRFKEFSGEWEEKSLGDIASKNLLKNKDEKVSFVLTNSATQGIISQRDYFDKDIANPKKLSNYYLVNKDDFVYNPRISINAPVGPIKRNHIGLGAMSPLYTVFSFNKGNKTFFEHFFETNNWHIYMKKISNHGARHDRMNIKDVDFFKMPILIPSIREQQKIANTLSSLDALIEAQNQKVEALKKHKKGLMQQLFPSEGERVPKLRFKEFSGEWEEKELSDIFDIFAGSDVPKEALSDKKTQEYCIPILSNGIGEKSLYGWTDKSKINEPSLTVSARGTIGWTSIQEKPFFPIVRLIVLTPKNQIILMYAYYYMKTIENDYKFAKVGIAQLTKPMIKNVIFKFPKDPKEQQKIANTLSSLDALIDAQNQKVEALKEHKKGLMQQMFVSGEG